MESIPTATAAPNLAPVTVLAPVETAAPATTSIRELVDRTRREQNLSVDALADEIGYSRPAVSAYLTGKYSASTSKMEAALLRWLQKLGVRIGSALPSTYVPTRATETVIRACDEAQEQGAFILVLGPPGVGKTEGIKTWKEKARKERLRHAHITATPLMRPVAMLRAIARELGLPDKGTSDAVLLAEQESLRREPHVLIVDEGQHLTVQCLEVLRAISDDTMCGLVLVGSMELGETLTRKAHGTAELAQLQDRIHCREILSMLTPVEVARFVSTWLGYNAEPAVLAKLREYSDRVPRRLVRLLQLCRRLAIESGTTIGVEHVERAADRLVTSRSSSAVM